MQSPETDCKNINRDFRWTDQELKVGGKCAFVCVISKKKAFSIRHCLPFHTFGAEGDLSCSSKHFLCHPWM